MRYAMIMAGGSGTRLWPMSRANRPKQLLRFIRRPGSGEARSLLEIAAARLEGIVPLERRYICTSEGYRSEIRRVLPEFTDDRILGEPVGRDTVNAVGFTAAVLLKSDPDATFAVLTADHLIEPDSIFRDRMELAFRLVEADASRLVTFAIKPTFPATGYGYVERGPAIHGVPGCVSPEGKPLAFRVARFVEKPNRHMAQAYFESGIFGWNSGMFVWKAATLMEALRKFKPGSLDGLLEIQRAWGTPAQRESIDAIYPTLPRTSVDYAVMEPASKDRQFTICTVETDVTWMDVGSWPTYGDTLATDPEGNRVVGPAVLHKSRGTMVVNDDPDHTIAVLGGEDLVVIHTKDATLVMPRARAEELKDLHGQVPESLK